MPTASMKDLKNNKLDKDYKSWWLASKRFACVFQFFRFYRAIDYSLLLITQQVCYTEKNSSTAKINLFIWEIFMQKPNITV